ncbi:MAG: hypothetical protein Kow00107_07750 [Planctomycetota bacterium]
MAYTAAVRNAAPGIPVVIGGIESSTRRLTHYDYWDNDLRRSILIDSKADILVYGMGERSVLEIAKALDSGVPVREIAGVNGTVRYLKTEPSGIRRLPSFEDCRASQRKFIEHYRIYEKHWQEPLAESANGRWILQEPPHPAMTTDEIDSVFDLPFSRMEHPSHLREGGVPALKTVESSIISHRGCLADCSFCSIAVHQGRYLSTRSKDSILKEARAIASKPGFSGTITDVGGPSANMYGMECKTGGCQSHNCVGSEVCRNLMTSHKHYLDLLDAVSKIPGVRHVFVGSGMRYDLLLRETDEVFDRLVAKHVGGQLKVAPEHSSERVLRAMRKPSWKKYLLFRERFLRSAARLGLKRHLVPYLITSHPGAAIEDELELLRSLQKIGFVPDQIQDFIPLPMTRSSIMFFCGVDPDSGESLKVARTREDKEKQFAVLRPKEQKYSALRKGLVEPHGGKKRGQRDSRGKQGPNRHS